MDGGKVTNMIAYHNDLSGEVVGVTAYARMSKKLLALLRAAPVAK
jgi:hypothetical protein